MSFFYRLNRYIGARVTEAKTQLSYHTRKDIGITSRKRQEELIVTMTTVPERISRVYLAIETLLTQSVKPDRVILWVSDEIPDSRLPENLKALFKRGLIIRRCKDIGPHTKIWYALQEYPEACLVTADDDVMYHKQWLSDLYKARKTYPNVVLCHRALKITIEPSLKQFSSSETWPVILGSGDESKYFLATNSYGTLYAPSLLHKEVFNQEAMLQLCPKADDIWLKAMALLNNVSVRVVDNSFEKLHIIPNSQDNFGLEKENVVGGGDNIQFESVMNHYDLWRRM